MTNYNERLYGILAKHNGELGITWENPDIVTPDTKQAISSLIKELVADAKPVKHIVQDDADIYDDYDHDREQLRHELQENNINIGHNSAIDQFEQNLLKVLGYEDEK